MNTRLKKFLHRDIIEKALDNNNNDFDYIYQEYERINFGANTSDLTLVFLKSNIDFLSYISKIYGGMFRALDIKSIAIPNNIKIIANSSFLCCRALDSVTIGDSVTVIGVGAFEGCTSLSSITLSDSLTTIVSYAFLNCTSLTSIKIPNSVTTIASYAFLNCTSLSSIIYQDTKKKWEEIVKGEHWNQNVQIEFIHCTDGDIKIE